MSGALPRLLATPETIAAVSRARAVAILIGSYDGSGNYGDIAQLDAALDLLAPLEPGILTLPVLERIHRADHEQRLDEFRRPPRRVIFVDWGEGGEDGLQPLPAPAELAFAAIYLYGGGYLNAMWGERKLAMLGAAEDLVEAGGATRVCRVSSGLQVDPGWIASLGEAGVGLRRFELLGARDPGSATALAALGSPAQVLDTGDDAVGVVRRVPVPAAPAGEDGLRLNIHIAEHEWVTDRPGASRDLYAALVAELQRLSGRQVVTRPLLAYLDYRIDEREGVERLAAAWAERGLELEEPLLLRPSRLGEQLAEIRRAALTLSCSYHVTLSSLLAGVPAVLLRDNPYYEQKADGLAAAFGLPPELSLSSGSDPARAAAGLAGLLADPARAAELGASLRVGSAALRERRAEVEAALLGRLGGAAASALTGALGESAERLRERSAEPAALRAQLARLDPGAAAAEEVPQPAADQQPAPPPADPAAQQQLEAVLNSSSWRLTAPLRRASGLFRRRR